MPGPRRKRFSSRRGADRLAPAGPARPSWMKRTGGESPEGEGPPRRRRGRPGPIALVAGAVLMASVLVLLPQQGSRVAGSIRSVVPAPERSLVAPFLFTWYLDVSQPERPWVYVDDALERLNDGDASIRVVGARGDGDASGLWAPTTIERRVSLRAEAPLAGAMPPDETAALVRWGVRRLARAEAAAPYYRDELLELTPDETGLVTLAFTQPRYLGWFHNAVSLGAALVAAVFTVLWMVRPPAAR
jgi:hypothetical protein